VDLVLLDPAPLDMRADFRAVDVPIHRYQLGSGFFRYPRLLRQTIRLCRRIQPDAVLSFPLGWHAFIAWGAKLAGVKRVCAHVGNLPPVWTGHAFTKFKTLVQLGRPATDRLLCCSDYIRTATIRDFRVAPHETRAIFNACDLERFSALQRPSKGRFQEFLRIGVVGRLDSNRDYPTLIRAIAILRDQDITVELWLIGEGSHRPQFEALVAKLELADRVKFLGCCTDIAELLGQLDLYAWPALSLEGFGIALAEAMAAGVPIVASDVGACRELLDDGRCGLLVEPGSPEALAAGIEAVLADPAAAGSRAELARERALREFSVAAMAEAYGKELGLSRFGAKGKGR
jgi:glycosyltransferase involved in cell wall biosynthesis